MTETKAKHIDTYIVDSNICSHCVMFDDKPYIKLHNSAELKTKSLEDNVYFTLRDIFLNISGMDYCTEANCFNNSLTGGISFEERTESFTYTDSLNEKYYLHELIRWLDYIHKSDFVFGLANENNIYHNEHIFIEIYDENKYMLFDDWWTHLCELKQTLKGHYEKLFS